MIYAKKSLKKLYLNNIIIFSIIIYELCSSIISPQNLLKIFRNKNSQVILWAI